ncbi:hypothetical protein ALC56_06641, partial [Trachymyrmex septentrionalis]
FIPNKHHLREVLLHSWIFSDFLPPNSGICDASNEIAWEEDIDARALMRWLRGAVTTKDHRLLHL